MSGYILCQTKKAEHPYYIKNISTNIYSMEELCYYLYNNLYLIDETILGEELCTWIAEELELPGLAAKIRPHMRKFGGVEDILYPIFKEINYLTYEELKRLNRRLSVMETEPILVKKKKKGDALADNRMYVSAIRLYESLLGENNLEKTKAGLTESIYHNLGCVCSYLFQMERALEYFKKAYECSRDEEALKTYLMAFRSMREQSEYEEECAKQRASAALTDEIEKTLETFSEQLPSRIKGELEEDQDLILEEFTREYHRSTNS